MKRIYDFANIILFVLMGSGVLANYSRLPERIPTHFDIAGRPDSWGGRSTILILAATALGLTALFYLLMPLVSRLDKNPQIVNIPRKDELFKLPPEKRLPYWDLMKEFMAGMACALNLLFYLLLRGTLRIAAGRVDQLHLMDIVPGMAVLFLMIVVYFVRMSSLPGKIIRGEVP